MTDPSDITGFSTDPFNHSGLIYDYKGQISKDNAEIIANNKDKFIVFDPASPDNQNRYNVLDEIRLHTPYETADVQNLVQIICDPEGEGYEDYWIKSAIAILPGIIIHLLYTNKENTASGILHFLHKVMEQDFDKGLFEEMLDTEHDPDGSMGWIAPNGSPTKTHPVVAMMAQEQMNKSMNEISGVIATSAKYFTAFVDPIIAKNTSAGNFKFSDLMTSTPNTVFFVVRKEDEVRLRPLIRLIFNLAASQAEKVGLTVNKIIVNSIKNATMIIGNLPNYKK